ncbi:MAG: nucleoside-diphosphate sugar epimerase [Bacteroidetes bacterium]|nr:MAG: nucleoside-diphosphate sugar epimerase [Bacteroidota bacterium]
MFHISEFINKKITGRSRSMFENDIEKHSDALLSGISGKKLLVIGGAGTIGSNFIFAMLKFKPAELYVIDNDENGLTELTRDLRSRSDISVPDVYKAYPMDFGDTVFEKLLANEGPFDIVANFAAHKHVRSEKDHYSIEAMFRNNVLKARRLLDLLLDNPPAHFFCVSTDKAANPVNLMGASKQLMENLIMAYSGGIKISTARFANVAFSNGSLLHGFVERMKKKQPLSSPSDIRRYFISPVESGQLCALACMLSSSGDIFFPKLEEDEMKIFSEIAVAFLKDQGLEARAYSSENEAKLAASQLSVKSTDYPVYFFKSDTSGEKSYEEFYTKGEELDMDSFEALGVIKNANAFSLSAMNKMMNKLRTVLNKPNLDKNELLKLMGELIPSFEYIEKGKNLDQKM